MTRSHSTSLSPEELAKIEQDFDPETSFRQFDPILASIVTFFLVTMSIYHFYASGFGLVRELVHRGIHISFVLGLTFLLFGLRRPKHETSKQLTKKGWFQIQGIPKRFY